jgi:hypothetical protein
MSKRPLSRRDLLLSTLFGAGYVGLRSLATGLPASLLLEPRRALADGNVPCAAGKAQFVVFATSGQRRPDQRERARHLRRYEDRSQLGPGDGGHAPHDPGAAAHRGQALVDASRRTSSTARRSGI